MALRSRPLSLLLPLLLSILFVESGSAKGEESSEEPPFTPTDQYHEETILGWNILIHNDLIEEHPQTCEQALAVLRHQLFGITRVVPEPALTKIRRVTIWLEMNDPHHPCAVYHPEADWLKENGMNPDKVDCVELANAETFIDWTIFQPWMVLHEMAHAYHDQFLPEGFENSEVKAAFDAAMEDGDYEEVLRANGTREKHYATTNQMEYFSEITEAYYGTNDFYPFIRTELQSHDEKGFQMLRKVWEAEEE